jgi:hypothetical protein
MRHRAAQTVTAGAGFSTWLVARMAEREMSNTQLMDELGASTPTSS